MAKNTDTPLEESLQRRLPERDRRVIVSIQHRADAPLEQVAVVAGEPVHTVRYVLHRLEEQGLLLDRVYFFNSYPLGLASMTVFLNFAGLAPNRHEAVIQEILKAQSVSWVGKLAGKFEYGVSFLTERGEEAQELLARLGKKFGDIIASKTVSTTCEFLTFPRRYLAPKIDCAAPFRFGFGGSKVTIDDLDRRLLAVASEHGVSAYRDLARRLKVSHTTIERRMHHLREKHIIQGAVYRLQLTGLGLHTYRLLIYTHAAHQAVEDLIMKFVTSELHVLRFTQVLAEWDYELEVEVFGIEALWKLTLELKALLGPLLRQVETVQILRHLKYRPFPVSALADR